MRGMSTATRRFTRSDESLTRPARTGHGAAVALSYMLRRKSVADSLADCDRPEHQLKRSLGAFHLTTMGVGAIVGAGIFSSVGEMAAGLPGIPGAGPALILSFALT